MANGKLVWTAPAVQALSLDQLHYVQLTTGSDDFNPGTADLTLDVLIRPDSTAAYPTAAKCILAKKYNDAEPSWRLGYVPYYKYVFFQLMVTDNIWILTPDGSVEMDSWSWVAVRADRDGNAVIYINGSEAASGSIAAQAGDLRNTRKFTVGHEDKDFISAVAFKGLIGLARVAFRLLPEQWVAAEWERLRWGLAPRAQDFQAVWRFDGSLSDEGGAYTLDWQNGGEAAYDTGWPSGKLSYELPINYEIGANLGYLEEGDLSRSLDGSLCAYWLPGRRRRHLEVTWRWLPLSQVEALRAAYEAGTEISVYLDADLPSDMTALITKPPEIEIAAPGEYAYSVALTLEEV